MELVAKAIAPSGTRGKWLIITQVTALILVAAGCIYLFWPRHKQAIESHGPSMVFPARVNIILDTSASMQGYLNGRTELKDNLAELVAQVDELRNAAPELKAVTYQFATDSGSIVDSGYDSREFIRRLLNDTLMTGRASLLQEVFRNAAAETSRDTVAIIITDSIFSYSDKEVKANPDINKNNIAGLAADITLTFDKAKAAGISASLLAARSHFHGKYYTYQNVARSCCSGLRPYYVWILGDAARIRGLLDFMQKHGSAYEHQLDFNQQTVELPATICQYTSKKGTWYTDQRDRRHMEDVQPDPASNDLQFALAVDLAALSKELSSMGFLNQHLLAKSSDVRVKNKAIYIKAAFESSLDRRDGKKLSSYTHVLVLTTDNSFAKHADITVLIEDAVPDWYVQWSNEDDTGDDLQTASTTFGLKEMVKGVALAYQRTEPVAKVTIRLDR